jgi:hypothetical protein
LEFEYQKPEVPFIIDEDQIYQNEKTVKNENLLKDKYKTSNLETVSEQGTLEDAESLVNSSQLN